MDVVHDDILPVSSWVSGVIMMGLSLVNFVLLIWTARLVWNVRHNQGSVDNLLVIIGSQLFLNCCECLFNIYLAAKILIGMRLAHLWYNLTYQDIEGASYFYLRHVRYTQEFCKALYFVIIYLEFLPKAIKVAVSSLGTWLYVSFTWALSLYALNLILHIYGSEAGGSFNITSASWTPSVQVYSYYTAAILITLILACILYILSYSDALRFRIRVTNLTKQFFSRRTSPISLVQCRRAFLYTFLASLFQAITEIIGMWDHQMAWIFTLLSAVEQCLHPISYLIALKTVLSFRRTDLDIETQNSFVSDYN